MLNKKLICILEMTRSWLEREKCVESRVLVVIEAMGLAETGRERTEPEKRSVLCQPWEP